MDGQDFHSAGLAQSSDVSRSAAQLFNISSSDSIELLIAYVFLYGICFEIGEGKVYMREARFGDGAQLECKGARRVHAR